MPSIAVVVPTIRESSFSSFIDGWFDLFVKHDVKVVKVTDGDDPQINSARAKQFFEARGLKADLCSVSDLRRSELRSDLQDLFSDHNPACRNLGFYWAATRGVSHFDVFLTLDDDCLPIEGTDPIQEHLDALARRWPLSWFSTTDSFAYMRGMPYGVRSEAEAIVSHGLWANNPDWDAPTELQERSLSQQHPEFEIATQHWYTGPIPKGVLYPHCGMHVALKREALPFYFHCPVEKFAGAERFDDIWMGLYLKKAVDAMPGKCIVSGCSVINHTRASDPFRNLAKEAIGIPINESLWRGEIEEQYKPFFDAYHAKRERYEQLLKPLV